MTHEPECKACTAAQDNPATPMFQSGCLECSTRALACSPQFFEADKAHRMTPAYRAALESVFKADPRAGHKRVKAWFERISQHRRDVSLTPPPKTVRGPLI